MREHLKKVLGWITGMFVTGALVVGLAVATTTPADASACANDGVWFLGSQPSAEACRDACVAIHGPEIIAVWNATTTCCKCML
jgi:hypothetical protein